MFINSVYGASSSGQTSQEETKKAAENRDVLDKDDFLKLLITQLRYQDPVNPVEDKEFIAQMAQFSSLEQMQNLNRVMEETMESQQKLTALTQATTMLGKTAEIFSKEGEALFGTVEMVTFKDGWPRIVVDGQSYDFTEVVSIQEGGEVENG